MEHEVIFSSGLEVLGGSRRCSLTRFSPEGAALILKSLENGQSILLGDVARLAPDSMPEFSAGELRELGCTGASGHGLLVLCRVAIPHARPQEACFDLSRLILIHEGKGLELERCGAPHIPLVASRRDGGA